MEMVGRLMQRFSQDRWSNNDQEAVERVRRQPMNEDPEPEFMYVGERPRWFHRWVRLIMLLNFSLEHAWTGFMIGYQEIIRLRREEEARLEYERLRGATVPKAAPKATRARAKGMLIPMAKGLPMYRSDRPRRPPGSDRNAPRPPWESEVANCDHPEERMEAGGNAVDRLWWTCLKCGARWHRIHGDTQIHREPAAEPPPTPSMDNRVMQHQPTGASVGRPWELRPPVVTQVHRFVDRSEPTLGRYQRNNPFSVSRWDIPTSLFPDATIEDNLLYYIQVPAENNQDWVTLTVDVFAHVAWNRMLACWNQTRLTYTETRALQIMETSGEWSPDEVNWFATIYFLHRLPLEDGPPQEITQ